MKNPCLFLLLFALPLLLAACGAQPPALPAETPPPSESPAPIVVMAPPAETPALPADPVEQLLCRMTPEEKLAQLLLLCCHDAEEAQAAAARGPGGLCLYAAAFADKDADEVRAMTAALQAAAPLPLLLAVDEEGGTVCRVSLNPKLRSEPFASPRTLLSRGGLALVESDAGEKARLLLSLGLNVNLAPVADVPLGRGNYIYDRCASTNPEKVSDYVSAAVGAMRREGLGTVLKHFPGYGGSADTHRGAARDERPYEAFAEGAFLPFAAGIAAGADAVLVSHNTVVCMDAQAPASLSAAVHRILREELGFEGVILCDDLGMAAAAGHDGAEPVVEAVLAGNDLLCCSDLEGALAQLRGMREDGLLTDERLDASVRRVLRWKLALGLDLG